MINLEDASFCDLALSDVSINDPDVKDFLPCNHLKCT